MENRRTRTLTVVLVLVGLLAGCDAGQLHAENKNLRQQLAQQAGKHQAELDFLEQQASIAAGCDWLFPLCPASIVETGHRAQAEGFGGGNAFPFWLAFIGKLLAIGGFLGGLGGISAWLWIRLGRPESEKLARAERMVKEADELAKAAQVRAAQEGAKLAQLHGETREAQTALDKIKTKIEASHRKLEAEKKDLESTKAARDALDAFD